MTSVRQLAENRLLLEPERFIGWYSWALALDPEKDSELMRGAFIAAWLLLGTDDWDARLDEVALRPVRYEGDALRLQKLEALADQARHEADVILSRARGANASYPGVMPSD